MKAVMLLAASVLTYPYGWSPGARNIEMDEKTLCDRSFKTSSIRPPVELTDQLKVQQIKDHPEIDCKTNGCEEDHVWPIEAGGDPGWVKIDDKWVESRLDNLSPQPYCPKDEGGKTCWGAREKDKVENFWHKEICAGRMTIDEVELQLPFWKEIYQREKL